MRPPVPTGRAGAFGRLLAGRNGALLALGMVAATVAAGCGGGAAEPDSAANPEVAVQTFMFEPDPIEIEAGEKVRWTNADSATHTVTSGPRDQPDGRFDEQLAESGGTAEHTFDRPGTYEYFCSLHSGPGMEATVVVR